MPSRRSKTVGFVKKWSDLSMVSEPAAQTRQFNCSIEYSIDYSIEFYSVSHSRKLNRKVNRIFKEQLNWPPAIRRSNRLRSYATVNRARESVAVGADDKTSVSLPSSMIHIGANCQLPTSSRVTVKCTIMCTTIRGMMHVRVACYKTCSAWQQS